MGTWRAARAEQDDITDDEAREALIQLDALWDELFPAEQARIVQLLVERVDVRTPGVEVRLRPNGLAGLVREVAGTGGPRRDAGDGIGRRGDDHRARPDHVPEMAGRKLVVTPDGRKWAPRPRVGQRHDQGAGAGAGVPVAWRGNKRGLTVRRLKHVPVWLDLIRKCIRGLLRRAGRIARVGALRLQGQAARPPYAGRRSPQWVSVGDQRVRLRHGPVADLGPPRRPLAKRRNGRARALSAVGRGTALGLDKGTSQALWEVARRSRSQRYNLRTSGSTSYICLSPVR